MCLILLALASACVRAGTDGLFDSISAALLSDSSCEEVPSEQKGEGLKTKDIWDLCNQGDHDGVRNVLEKGESPNLNCDIL